MRAKSATPGKGSHSCSSREEMVVVVVAVVVPVSYEKREREAARFFYDGETGEKIFHVINRTILLLVYVAVLLLLGRVGHRTPQLLL